MSSAVATTSAAFLEALVQNGRNPVEVLIKTIVLHVTCLFAVGHLASLQRRRRTSAAFEVLLYSLCPTIPIAKALLRVSDSVYRLSRRWQLGRTQNNVFGWTYWACACLGVHATCQGSGEDVASSVALDSIDPNQDLQRTSNHRDLRVWARVIGLLVFITQASLAIVQWGRRIRFSYLYSNDVDSYYKFADSAIDTMNALMVAGALFAALSSLLLQSLNVTWRYTGPDPVSRTEDDDGIAESLSNRQAFTAFALQNLLIYRYIYFTFIKYCGEAWSDIAHGNYLSFSLGTFVSTLLVSSHLLLLGLFSSFGIIQLIPIALPTCFAIGNSGASEMIFWWVIPARIGHLSILLYHLGMMFDCHKLGIDSCLAPLFMWKDPQIDKYWTF